MDRNFVKKGDKVIQYVTPIGTVGDGNGKYYAHLHFSISNGLDVKKLQFPGRKNDLYHYINGWSKEKVKKYYKNPKHINFEEMFDRPVDVGSFGYDWLQKTDYGFHPGVDVNGLFGGNSDFGYAFKASCTGTVVYEWRGWTKNGGWGNIIVVEADTPTALPVKDYYLKSQLRNEARNKFWMGGEFDHTNPKDHIALAEKMEKIRKG